MIALDVMGGDYAPDVVLEAAVEAARGGVSILLFGPSQRIQESLSRLHADWAALPLKIVDAPDTVGMDEEPVFAVRKKPQSSLVMAVSAVARGQASAVVSAGNSGALMAAAAFIIGRIDGIERPAIAGFFPSHSGRVLVLDLGANTECRPQHLLQFAQLGDAYARELGISNPRIGLLANGHEETKGSLLVKEAHQLIKQDGAFNFIGNIEPYDIIDHKADVVVCDGFSGNILLKTQEAVIEAAAAWTGNAAALEEHMTHRTVGGALLLGVKGRVIVCHGASDAKMLKNALFFAAQKS